MLLTIKCPTKAKLNAGLWEAQVMLGMDTEVFEGNVFEIAAHDEGKVAHILNKCDGEIVAQVPYKIVKPT